MSLIDNERTKLLANALDRASTACFTIGILSPLAGYVYGVVDLGPAIIQRWPIFSVFAWLAVLSCTTSMGETHSERPEIMSNQEFLLWFWALGLPAIIAIGGYVAVRLHERSLKH